MEHTQVKKPSKHIVFAYADTGGGHRTTAQAAAKAVHQLYGDTFSTDLVNAINYLPYPFNQMEKAYPLFVNSLTTAYHAFWQMTDTPQYVDFIRHYIELTSKVQSEAFLREHPADLYVSCQPILDQFIPGAVEQGNLQTPVIAIVSDLVTVHAGFWSPKIDHFIVPTEEARQRALENNIPAYRISITGQPVAPDFAMRARSNSGQTRRDLGLDPTRLTILLMGGGDGMGRLVETAQAIAHSQLPVQLVAVCGRNEHARKVLSELQTDVPVQALGFRNDIPELMGAADVLVTKAGPGTICEGFIAGLPIILYDAVPGQETGNIDYVVGKGVGAWCPSPELVVNQLRAWINQPAARQRARQASAALAMPDSALNIARIVAAFTEPVPQPSHSEVVHI